MAIQTGSATSSGSFSSLSISGTTSKSGNMSWSIPTLPDGATITSTSVTYTLNVSMTRGAATITVNDTTRTAGTYTLDLGTSSNTSVSVTAKGGNKNATGTVSISNIVYTVNYQYDDGVNEYTVRFLDWNGDVLKTETVEEGGNATPPSYPIRYGYLCIGWDNYNYTNIASDLDITAQYVQEYGVPSNNIMPLFNSGKWIGYEFEDIQRKESSISAYLTSAWGGLNIMIPSEWAGKTMEFGFSNITDNTLVIIQDLSTGTLLLTLSIYNLSGEYTFPDNVSSIKIAITGGDITTIWVTDLYAKLKNTSPAPIITIVSQDKTKISGISGYDRCTVTFTADQALSYWEARATTSSQVPSHGTGLLVESGALDEGATGYIYVDDEELTNGDLNYRIDIYGQNSDGVWSDE